MKTKTPVSGPQIIIPVGEDTMKVNVDEFSSFFEACREVKISDIRAIELELELISSMVLDGADEALSVSEIRRPLILLRELRFLFNAAFLEMK